MVKAMFTLCLNPATSSFAEMTDRQGGNLKLPSINTSWWLPAPPRSVFLQRNRCPLGPVSNNPSTGTVQRSWERRGRVAYGRGAMSRVHLDGLDPPLGHWKEGQRLGSLSAYRLHES